MRTPLTIAFLLVLFIGASCSKTAQEKAAPPDTTSNESPNDTQLFEAAGTIKSIPSNKKLIIIDHGEIPGFMMAMTMPFNVVDSTMIQALKPQDSVHFVIAYDGTDIILKEINRVDRD